ncbi:MAG: hypothetical protein WBW71_07990 [Bacteroidota bacterium]
MKRIFHNIFFFTIYSLSFLRIAQAQQTDTSSFFPLGLWGVWIDSNMPPFYNNPVGSKMWNQEKINWQDIKGNTLIWGMPRSVEDTVMMYADTINYKMGVSNWDNVTKSDTNSLTMWIQHDSLGLADSARPIGIIQSLKNKYGTHPAFYSYQLTMRLLLIRLDVGHISNSWRARFINWIIPGKLLHQPATLVHKMGFSTQCPISTYSNMMSTPFRQT